MAKYNYTICAFIDEMGRVEDCYHDQGKYYCGVHENGRPFRCNARCYRGFQEDHVLIALKALEKLRQSDLEIADDLRKIEEGRI